MEIMGIGSVAAITVICYLIGLVCHNIQRLDNKWIPCIVGGLGMIYLIETSCLKILNNVLKL